jgi:hypothetical protein
MRFLPLGAVVAVFAAVAFRPLSEPAKSER